MALGDSRLSVRNNEIKQAGSSRKHDNCYTPPVDLVVHGMTTEVFYRLFTDGYLNSMGMSRSSGGICT